MTPAKFIIFKFLITCVYVCVSMCGHVSSEVRSIVFPGAELQVVMSYPTWILGIDLQISARAVHAFNCSTISLALAKVLLEGSQILFSDKQLLTS